MHDKKSWNKSSIEMIKFQKVFQYKVIPTKPLHFFELSWDISYICKDLASSSTLIKLISLLSFMVVTEVWIPQEEI